MNCNTQMKILTHPLFILFFTLCIIAFSAPMLSRDYSNQDKQKQIQQLINNNTQLKTQKEALEYQKLLSEQPITQEKVLRDQLWRQKPGEVVFNLTDFEADQEPPAAVVEAEMVPWAQWWKLLWE